ncbi:ABC transporter substrate-binding protein [Synechococcus sp. LTW-R]|uniref:ABC transporter substrate-binding protein n=1 Tax=Synechococcus sp. LTW-R TaxID=2751170 RepID=UPI001625DAA3|nr:ABC transporter substrate-binding protein [Synechococcus sp. LTW-R]QNG30869.1 ABC transporter substrate-binding protein [Synechococcus sp. LTW-R]
MSRRAGLLTLGCLLGSLLLSVALWAKPAPEPVSILMPAPFADATAELVETFNREHPGIALSVTRGPLETEAVSDLAISSLLLGNSPYDVLLMDVTWTPKYAKAGWLEPLEAWLGADALEDLAPGAELGNAFDGHLWRFPLVADMGLLFWRTDLMEAPPRTPSELEAISQSLQQEGRVRWGYVWEGRQYEGLSCTYLEVLRGFGGRWLRDGSPDLNSNAAIAASQWLRHLVDVGITPPAVANMAEPEALQTFETGDAAFMRNWPYAWAELNKNGSLLAGKVGITTMVSEPQEPHVATQGSWGLSVLSSSQHKQAAVEALQFLTSNAAQKQLNLNWGYTPTRLSVFEDPELIRANPVLPELQAALAAAVLRPVTPIYAQLSDLLYREVNTVITGEVAAAPAMETLQRNSIQLERSTGGIS